MRHPLLALTLLFISAIDTAAQSRQFVTTPPAQPFTVYPMGGGMFLRLNTATGQIYQIQVPTQNDPSLPPSPISPTQRVVNASVLNDACLASGNGSVLAGNGCVAGRFTIVIQVIIDGVWVGGEDALGSILLLDQQLGQTWLLSLDAKRNYMFAAVPGA